MFGTSPVLNVRQMSLMSGIRTAIPELKKSGGQILVTTSGMAYMRVPNNSDYAVSKLAVNGIVEFIHLGKPV